MGSHELCHIRKFPEHDAVNRPAFPLKLFFKRAQCNCRFPLPNHDKLRRSSRQALDLSEIFGFICRDPNEPSLRQGTREKNEEAFGQNSARGMAPLRPGIGKHQMKRRDGIREQQFTHSVRDFALEDARVGHRLVFDLAGRASHSSRQSFHPQKISRGIRHCGCSEKGAVTTTKIDLKWSATTVDRLEVQRREIIRRDNFRMSYDAGSSGHTE